MNVRLKIREKGNRSTPGNWSVIQSVPMANHGLRTLVSASTMMRKISSLWWVLMDFMKCLTMVYDLKHDKRASKKIDQ
jgi:hypothetical protein